jgi:hypothetical protein
MTSEYATRPTVEGGISCHTRQHLLAISSTRLEVCSVAQLLTATLSTADVSISAK